MYYILTKIYIIKKYNAYMIYLVYSNKQKYYYLKMKFFNSSKI